MYVEPIFDLQLLIMNRLQWGALVFVAALACVQSHRLLSERSAEDRQLSEVSQGTAAEHQRILAELEEVHQLRERMLQEGKVIKGLMINTYVTCPLSMQSVYHYCTIAGCCWN